jgi:hypothetical protein
MRGDPNRADFIVRTTITWEPRDHPFVFGILPTRDEALFNGQ